MVLFALVCAWKQADPPQDRLRSAELVPIGERAEYKVSLARTDSVRRTTRWNWKIARARLRAAQGSSALWEFEFLETRRVVGGRSMNYPSPRPLRLSQGESLLPAVDSAWRTESTWGAFALAVCLTPLPGELGLDEERSLDSEGAQLTWRVTKLDPNRAQVSWRIRDAEKMTWRLDLDLARPSGQLVKARGEILGLDPDTPATLSIEFLRKS
ncbi:MAG TPA: hypothetical protein PLO61_08805 [Fimbriimonadaceae bacterium]|nr:hypothetical protein [Fimbriimonadaceae bacterium]HRJ33606.1 hypothetical protein [Fimbriimonadaceae bacterium]